MAAFKWFWAVTQGDPFSLTIFNVMVEAVVIHWASLAEERAEGKDRCGREG